MFFCKLCFVDLFKLTSEVNVMKRKTFHLIKIPYVVTTLSLLNNLKLSKEKKIKQKKTLNFVGFHR